MDRETKALLDCLENQRGHVVGILDGLSSEALHQTMLPSEWTSLGLVNHLALDVERFWFRQVVSAETFDLDPDGDAASSPSRRVTPATSMQPANSLMVAPGSRSPSG
jgi:hypothetical protein